MPSVSSETLLTILLTAESWGPGSEGKYSFQGTICLGTTSQQSPASAVPRGACGTQKDQTLEAAARDALFPRMAEPHRMFSSEVL
ncbi:hypothetical protein LEMLEM_LOCUS15123 [Lemmus lemmus]